MKVRKATEKDYPLFVSVLALEGYTVTENSFIETDSIVLEEDNGEFIGFYSVEDISDFKLLSHFYIDNEKRNNKYWLILVRFLIRVHLKNTDRICVGILDSNLKMYKFIRRISSIMVKIKETEVQGKKDIMYFIKVKKHFI